MTWFITPLMSMLILEAYIKCEDHNYEDWKFLIFSKTMVNIGRPYDSNAGLLQWPEMKSFSSRLTGLYEYDSNVQTILEYI